MKWCFDLDGVITTNPDFFKLLTYFLKKKRNHNEVIILSARNPSRQEETINELKAWNISYDRVIFMPTDLTRDSRTQGNWKKATILGLNADLWFDNDFKWYERDCGIDFSDLKCERIEI